uniref:C-type lectin domain-containing protein n=1 Tax=Syphacia muris TaxID=451379 RepID=A0A0N5AHQ6_9BILA
MQMPILQLNSELITNFKHRSDGRFKRFGWPFFSKKEVIPLVHKEEPIPFKGYALFDPLKQCQTIETNLHKIEPRRLNVMIDKSSGYDCVFMLPFQIQAKYSLTKANDYCSEYGYQPLYLNLKNDTEKQLFIEMVYYAAYTAKRRALRVKVGFPELTNINGRSAFHLSYTQECTIENSSSLACFKRIDKKDEEAMDSEKMKKYRKLKIILFAAGGIALALFACCAINCLSGSKSNDRMFNRYEINPQRYGQPAYYQSAYTNQFSMYPY